MRLEAGSLFRSTSSRRRPIRALLVAAILGGGRAATSAAAADTVALTLVKTAILTTDAEGGSARPEIVATSNRVFVLYLGNIGAAGARTFNLKIFDTNLVETLASQVLVETTTNYGSPTDIRAAADERYLYAFYETAKTTSPTSSTTHLWGAAYTLDDRFARVAYTPAPLAVSRSLAEVGTGEELLDDPAPLVCPDAVFVVTRLHDTLAQSGRTVYRARGFGKTDGRLYQADLDLSAVADGRARVASLLYWNDTVYMALPTTTGTPDADETNDDRAPADIIGVRLRWDGAPDGPAVILAGNAGDRENYVSGFKTNGRYFFVTHHRLTGSPPAGENAAWIKIYDGSAILVHEEKVKSTVWGADGGEVRPSLEVSGNRVYSGQSGGEGLGQGHAEIYVYELSAAATTD